MSAHPINFAEQALQCNLGCVWKQASGDERFFSLHAFVREASAVDAYVRRGIASSMRGFLLGQRGRASCSSVQYALVASRRHEFCSYPYTLSSSLPWYTDHQACIHQSTSNARRSSRHAGPARCAARALLDHRATLERLSDLLLRDFVTVPLARPFTASCAQ